MYVFLSYLMCFLEIMLIIHDAPLKNAMVEINMKVKGAWPVTVMSRTWSKTAVIRIPMTMNSLEPDCPLIGNKNANHVVKHLIFQFYE